MKIPFAKGLLSSVEGVLNSVEGAIECFSSSSLEKEKLKNSICRAIIENADREIEAKQAVIMTEAKGNWLQCSWRPIVMLTFAAIVVVGIFVDVPILKEGSPFWEVLQLGLGGYVIGRSAEKISSNLKIK